MASEYLKPGATFRTTRKSFVKLLALTLAFLVSFSVVTFTSLSSMAPQKAEAAFDPIQWLACYFGPDSKPDLIYQATQGTEIQFNLFSKSRIGSARDDVRTGLNGILEYTMTGGRENSPYTFEAVNERIIGQNFEGSLPVNDRSYERWNRGDVVNPYNRFGVAGLQFSNYAGEWKHLFIDACEDDDQPDAQYDTGASTNVVKVASWNVCSFKNQCNRPDVKNPATGVEFTPDEIWEDFPDRMARGYSREMTTIRPDVLLAQEVKNEGDGNTQVFYDTLCADLTAGVAGPSPQTMCYNSEKFRAVSNNEFDQAQGVRQFDFDNVLGSNGGGGGYAWMVLEDQSLRRSVFVSIHLAAGTEDDTRQRQAEYVVEDLTRRFAGSFYPIIVGGDFNSYEPKGCSGEQLRQLPEGKDGGARAFCAGGFVPANSLATTRVDLEKKTFQGFSPWSSANGITNPPELHHFDHIWVNSYVGVGEGRVFAPAGRASSDHAMISATVNLNGLSVAQPGDPQDPQTNKYYDTRLEPRSVWEDIVTSEDVRTRQFDAGFGSRFFSSWLNNLTNWIFWFTKFIVVMTIAFIGLAFADVGKMTKVTEIVAGSGSTDPGVFGRLHEGVFEPLIITVMLLTGIYLFWTAVVRRQIRAGLGGLFKSLACFLAAVVIAVSPAWFIALPNNVALVTQALVVSQLDEGLAGGNGLCDSNLDAADSIMDGNGNLNPVDKDDAPRLLERASVNMQSGVGCMLWYHLLLRPWTEGQFGAEYTELYGTENGNCVTRGNSSNVIEGLSGKYVCLGDEQPEKKNRNFRWVGDPLVPLGGGNCNASRRCDAKLESNWALLQISTQTNAHSPIVPPEDRGAFSKYSQGVANDWWRIADAMSNYDEERKSLQVCGQEEGCTGANGISTTPYSQPLPTQVLEEWDDWVGGNQGSRLWTVIMSVLIAGIGVLAPLVFAALSTIYALGITILMALAPIFFLLGAWPGAGWNIFKAWADLVINTTMKRIALGLLTVLSIAFTTGLLNQMEQLGTFQTLMLIVLISFALVKSRAKIFAAVSFARFSTADLSGTASKITSKVQGTAKAGSNLALAGAVGGVGSARRGEGFRAGAVAGLKHQADNLTYRSKFLRSVKTGSEMGIGGTSKYLNEICPACDEPLLENDEFGRFNGPEIFGIGHADCARNSGEYTKFEELGVIEAPRSGQSTFALRSAEISRLKEEALEEGVVDAELPKIFSAIVDDVRRDENNKRLWREKGGLKKSKPTPPNLPAEIAPYVDSRALAIAWEDGSYEYVKLAYASGWLTWLERETGAKLSADDKLRYLSSIQN